MVLTSEYVLFLIGRGTITSSLLTGGAAEVWTGGAGGGGGGSVLDTGRMLGGVGEPSLLGVLASLLQYVQLDPYKFVQV